MTPPDKEDKDPQSLPQTITLPTDPIPAGATLEQVQSRDALLTAVSFQGIAAAWSQARDIDSLLKCASATFKAMKERRDLLGLPRDYQAPRERKEFMVYPID